MCDPGLCVKRRPKGLCILATKTDRTGKKVGMIPLPKIEHLIPVRLARRTAVVAAPHERGSVLCELATIACGFN